GHVSALIDERVPPYVIELGRHIFAEVDRAGNVMADKPRDHTQYDAAGQSYTVFESRIYILVCEHLAEKPRARAEYGERKHIVEQVLNGVDDPGILQRLEQAVDEPRHR